MLPRRTEPVEMLKSFKRDENLKDAEILTYPELEMKAQEALDAEGRIFNEFEASDPGSVEEEDRARAAAVGYLVLTGLQLQHADSERQAIVSERFTKASIELYGQPEASEVAAMTARKQKQAESLLGKPDIDQDKLKNVISFYKEQLGSSTYEAADMAGEQLGQALDKFQEMLKHRYAQVCDAFQEVEQGGKVSPKRAQELFQRGIDVLADTDEAWNEWKVEIAEGRTSSSDAKEKIVKVGNISREENKLLPLFAHEVLVHSLRAVNGSKLGDSLAEQGMPDYLPAEEGITTFMQRALSGERQAPHSDLYMHIGFALGSLGHAPVPRHQLQQFYLDKLIIERQAQGKDVDIQDLTSKSWTHVNRIYRGTLGSEVVAVNTKDIAYHQGFVQVSRYIIEELDAGTTPEEIFDFLMQAKFDPLNSKHILYLDELKAQQDIDNLA
jgi:hypothetical protein